MRLAKSKTDAVSKIAMTDLNTIAETEISALLKKNGYFSVTKQGEYLFADSAIRRMIVIVKIAAHPNRHAALSESEVAALKIAGVEFGREPWVARITIKGGQLSRPIEWSNLSL